jgi:hypothetical protein
LHFRWCWYQRAISAIGRATSHEIRDSCDGASCLMSAIGTKLPIWDVR